MYKFSASMMCANPFKLESEIKVLDKCIDYYHIDIMDGHFVPNITLSVDYVRYLKKNSTKPIDIHLMVTDPNHYIDELLEIGVNCISFHLETVQSSVFRLINKIKNAGCKVGLAVNPSSIFEALQMFLPMIDKVIVMTVEPGYAGQPMIKEVLPKIKHFSDLKKDNNYLYSIEIDGSNNFTTFDAYIENGAEISILGTGLFNDEDLEENFNKIKEFVYKESLKRVVLSIDIGGTFTRYGLIDDKNAIIEQKKISTFRDKNDFVEWLIDYVNKIKIDNELQAIVIGFPGIVNQSNLEVISLPNLNGLEGKGYLLKVQEELQLPIYINKDTTHLLEYDIYNNNVTNKNVLGFYLGTGFGHAMLLNGSFYVGDTSSAGEIGHLNLFDNSVVCGCGQPGCTETKVSGRHLQQIRDEYFKDTEIDNLFVQHKNEKPIIEFVQDLARVISISLNLLDVTTIIVGGGVFSMDDFPIDMLIGHLKKYLRSDKMRAELNILHSQNSSMSGVLGGALYYKRNGEI